MAEHSASGAHPLNSTPPVVAIGGSAGSVPALQAIVRGLPADFGATVLVVVHVAADSPGLLPEIIGQTSTLPVQHAREGDTARAGRIYVAPPDWHLLVRAKTGNGAGGLELALSRSARENRHRPAIDPLFRSVAAAVGARAVAVVLSGLLDDGAAGAREIKAAGGTLIVQTPALARHPEMPENALRAAGADWLLAPEDMPAKLVELSQAAANRWAPTEFSCPECHGVLMRHGDGLRCRTGHAYGWASLAAEYAAGTENALWVALRTLREKAALARRMADHAQPGFGQERFHEQAATADAHADRIRDMIEHLTSLADLAAPTAPEPASR